MTIKITAEDVRDERTRTVTLGLEDVPDMERQFARSHIMRPRSLRIVFIQLDSGLWRFDKSTLSGPRVLRTRLGDLVDEKYWDHKHAPEWAQELIQDRLTRLNSEED